MSDRADILDAARAAVTVDRAAVHGSAERSFGAIAAHWSAHLAAAHGCHVQLTGADVALMMILMKVVRAGGNPSHGDSWVDIAGYAACGGEIAGMA